MIKRAIGIIIGICVIGGAYSLGRLSNAPTPAATEIAPEPSNNSDTSPEITGNGLQGDNSVVNEVSEPEVIKIPLHQILYDDGRGYRDGEVAYVAWMAMSRLKSTGAIDKDYRGIRVYPAKFELLVLMQRASCAQFTGCGAISLKMRDIVETPDGTLDSKYSKAVENAVKAYGNGTPPFVAIREMFEL